MAVGRVESTNFPYLPLCFTLGGTSHEAEGLVDTGFEGHLAVPEGWPVSEEPYGYQTVGLADGSERRIPYYRGVAAIGGLEEFECLVLVLGDEIVLGRFATDRYLLILDHGRRILVEP